MNPDLQPGIRFDWSYTIPERATVPNLYHDIAFCREMPNVLATGFMVGMMEQACANGIMPYVDWPREQSVGTMVSFRHLAASSAGMNLDIKGEVIAVEGRRVTFQVEAWDGIDKICEGIHERAIIDAEKFNTKMAAKKSKAGL